MEGTTRRKTTKFGFYQQRFLLKKKKSRRICESLLDIAKSQIKRYRIERDNQEELRGKEKEEEKKVREKSTKCCRL